MPWTFNPFTGTLDYYPDVTQLIDWQESVLDKDLSAPPGSPATGARYIVKATGSGAWTGQSNNIAQWDGTQWIFTTRNEGMACWVEDENIIYVYNGTSWVKMASIYAHNDLSGLQGGTSTERYHLSASQISLLVKKKELFFLADFDNDVGEYRVKTVDDTASWRFTFNVPIGATHLEINLIGWCDGDLDHADIDLFSNFAEVGEPYDAYAESDTTSEYDMTRNKVTAVDLSSVFSHLVEGSEVGSVCGLRVYQRNSQGSKIQWLGIRLRFD
jgi:hypothetical protein